MNAQNTSNSKRLVKNTAYMYVRMILLTIITLYTSRVILQQLGVEDYGIYNVVGSIVLMFNSLKSIFATSTQRFMNYEMGRGNDEKLGLIYNISTLINIIIAIILVVAVEAVGIWFLEYKINLDPSRFVAAHWVFQFSVITTVVTVLTNPLNAAIIAHERMDFYAYLSFFEAVAKLVICFLLIYSPFDKLIYYAFLVLLIQIFVYFANWMFCKRNFQECKFSWVWDKKYFMDMTKFAGWAFFGNTSFALSQSGINMVLNIFGGPVVNAARGIAYQVSTALNGFISNIVLVVRPFAIKTYSNGEIDKTLKLVYISSKLYFVIQLMILIVFTFLAKYIIQIWLGQVPEYSVLFIILVLMHSLVKALHSPLDILFCAEGNIKYYQLYEGVVLALPIPLSYGLLSYGFPFYTAFLSIIGCEVLHVAGITLLAKYICHLEVPAYLSKVIMPCALCYLIYCLGVYIEHQLTESFVVSISATFILAMVTFFTMLMIGFDHKERMQVLSLVKKRPQ